MTVRCRAVPADGSLRAAFHAPFLHRVGFTSRLVADLRVSSYLAFPSLPLRAVFFCCTFLEVASTGRYPALLLCGARTFLVSFPTQPFGCLLRRKCTTFFAFCQRMKAQGRLLCREPAFFLPFVQGLCLYKSKLFNFLLGVWLVCSKFSLCNTIV